MYTHTHTHVFKASLGYMSCLKRQIRGKPWNDTAGNGQCFLYTMNQPSLDKQEPLHHTNPTAYNGLYWDGKHHSSFPRHFWRVMFHLPICYTLVGKEVWPLLARQWPLVCWRKEIPKNNWKRLAILTTTSR